MADTPKPTEQAQGPSKENVANAEQVAEATQRILKRSTDLLEIEKQIVELTRQKALENSKGAAASDKELENFDKQIKVLETKQSLIKDIYDFEAAANAASIGQIEKYRKNLELINKAKENLQILSVEQLQIEKELEILQIRLDGASDEEREKAKKERDLKKKDLEEKIKAVETQLKSIENNEKELKIINAQVENKQKLKNFGKDLNEDVANSVFSAAGLNDEFKKLTELGPAAFNPTLAFAKQIQKVSLELFSNIMEGNREFAASTGQIADRTVFFGTGLTQFGIGFEKLNKASIALFQNMSNFSNQTLQVQQNLAESAAKMENLGVNAAATGKNFEALTLGLKMSSEEAIKTNELLAKEAIGAGIAPAKMVEGLANEMPRLAAYGKNAINVYVDMQKAAKSLGIEMSALNSIIGDQFDTFEGSARAAGKLNAVLGGNYLNSVEMLNATESERIVLLKRSFDESGKNFDSLGKYEKKAIAATLGIKDLNEASKLFGKSTSDLSMDMEKQAASQAKLEEVQREAAKVTDQLKEIFNGLMLAIRPIVTVVKALIDGFLMINDYGKGLPALLLGIHLAVVTLGGGWKVLTGNIITAGKSIGNFFADFSGNMGKIKDAASSGISFISQNFRKMGESMSNPLKTIGELKEKMTTFFKEAEEAAGKAKGVGEKLSDAAKNKVEGALGGAPAGAAPAVPEVPSGTVESTKKASEGAEKVGGFKNFMKGLREGFQEFAIKAGETLKGAATFMAAATLVSIPLLIIGGLIAKKMIEPVGVLAFTAGLLLLAVAMKIIGQIASPDLIVKGALFSIAAVLISAGLVALMFALKIMGDVDYAKVLFGIVTIGLLVAAVALLGTVFAGPQALALVIGAAILIGLAATLIILGAALLVLGAGLKMIGELSSELPKSIVTLSTSLAFLTISLAGLMAIGAAGSTGFGLAAFAVGLGMMVASVVALAIALEAIPDEKVTSLKTFNETLTTVKGLTEEDLKPTKDFVATAKLFYEAQAQSKDAEKDALTALLKEISASMNKKEEKGATPVNLIVSGADLAKALKGTTTTKVAASLTGPTKLD